MEEERTLRLPSVHPGDVLLEDFLKPLGITPYRLAKQIGVPQTRIAAILDRKRGITADTALRLGRVFNTTPEFWLNLQASFEIQEARSQRADSSLCTIQPFAREEDDALAVA
jgi:antitoxin HigA-1